MRCSALIGSFFTIEWWWICRGDRWKSAWSCTKSHYRRFKVSSELFWLCFLYCRHFDTTDSQVLCNNHCINHVRTSFWGKGTFFVSFWTNRWTFEKLRVEPWPLDVDCSQTHRNFKISDLLFWANLIFITWNSTTSIDRTIRNTELRVQGFTWFWSRTF